MGKKQKKPKGRVTDVLASGRTDKQRIADLEEEVASLRRTLNQVIDKVGKTGKEVDRVSKEQVHADSTLRDVVTSYNKTVGVLRDHMGDVHEVIGDHEGSLMQRLQVDFNKLYEAAMQNQQYTMAMVKVTLDVASQGGEEVFKRTWEKLAVALDHVLLIDSIHDYLCAELPSPEEWAIIRSQHFDDMVHDGEDAFVDEETIASDCDGECGGSCLRVEDGVEVESTVMFSEAELQAEGAG